MTFFVHYENAIGVHVKLYSLTTSAFLLGNNVFSDTGAPPPPPFYYGFFLCGKLMYLHKNMKWRNCCYKCINRLL